MRINNISLDVCVSSLQGYQYDSMHTKKELILEINRYNKYIRLYLLDKHLGYVCKRDTSFLFGILNNMNKYVKVNKWSLQTETNHYIIIRLHLQSYPKYRYYIYQLSFIGTHETYIGSTQNLPQRINTHKKKLKYKTHINHLLQEAYDKYPSLMQVNILFTGDTNSKEVKFQKEQEFILKCKPSLNLINSYTPKGKVVCECGREMAYSSLKSHKKTKYHTKRVISNIVSDMVDNVVTQTTNE